MVCFRVKTDRRKAGWQVFSLTNGTTHRSFPTIQINLVSANTKTILFTYCSIGSFYHGNTWVDFIETKKESRKFCSLKNLRLNYLTMLATSSAKLSSFFSMPSPFSIRAKSTTAILPPSSAATLSTYFWIVRSPSLTNSCSKRQFSL